MSCWGLWLGLLSACVAHADSRLVSFSTARQAVVIGHDQHLRVLQTGQTHPQLQLRVERVRAEGVELRFLGLERTALTAHVMKGEDLAALREELARRQRPPESVPLEQRP